MKNIVLPSSLAMFVASITLICKAIYRTIAGCLVRQKEEESKPDICEHAWAIGIWKADNRLYHGGYFTRSCCKCLIVQKIEASANWDARKGEDHHDWAMADQFDRAVEVVDGVSIRDDKKFTSVVP